MVVLILLSLPAILLITASIFDVANYDFSMSAFEEMDLVAGIEVLQFADGLYSVSDIQAWLSGGDAARCAGSKRYS